jgi:hypothetical protein
MNYHKVNNYFGWWAFFIALLTYTLTLEPSASFWDCGEFIACIYRLQVAHQPGAPLFTMIGKVVTLLSLGDNTKVAWWANMTSALASAATILFLFWTITALAKKILVKKAEDLTFANLILIMGAGMVGALAYTYSDTFWSSAVESEVYAQSSLCTAIVFWAILKWDTHADEPYADKWIVFIAYIMGLSIGIHLLNLLVIPPIALVICFRRSKNSTIQGAIGAFLLGCVILGAILWGIIQYSVKGAAFADLFFVNTLGFGFGNGAITFYVVLFALIIAGIYYTTVKKHFTLNTILVCAAFIFFGYSSFIMIVIRAKAGTNLNNSDPQDAFTLNSYLNRDQYGDTPLLYGQYFDAKITDQIQGATIYRRGKTRYEAAGKKLSNIYDHNTVFPRMFSQRPDKAEFYKSWEQLGDKSPTFADNLGFFFTWQINQMYTRYFLWNFVGRTNEMDGQDSSKGIDGNWISGWNFKQVLPASVTQSKSYNRLYFFPLILGLLGAVYHFRRNQRFAGVVGVLFFFTGLAIVLYLNQNPNQPRERDYAYAGSFYAFAIWIGLGVLFVGELLSKKERSKNAAILATVVCLSMVPVLMAGQEWDDHDRSTKLTPHDMAYNYLNSCAPNAILFTYADNDTYPMWYLQEVENVRPDVRIVNLSLLGADWYIRQMKTNMNQSAPLPITMPNEKFEKGVRDVIYYNDAKINGSMEIKDVFNFIISDDNNNKAKYDNGDMVNYLPTKNFSITTNTNEVLKTGTVAADKKGRIAPAMEFVYPSNYVTKDYLTLIDILAHNNWKRPIYFALTVPPENMMGMQQYMYNEGFAYRLLPLKPDTTSAPLSTDNTMVMYNNLMTRFKWGNMKNAGYLDHESLTLFYPMITTIFLNLTQNLMHEGRNDLAKNILEKYDAVMPSIIPLPDVAIRKYYMAQSAYQLNNTALANKISKQLYNYLTNMLYYNYILFQDGRTDLNNRDIQLGMSVLNGLAELTGKFNQTALSNQFREELKGYEAKFGAVK